MSDRAFVGREQELSRLDAYLDAALAGQGQVCLVAGEPGAGKTALVREFVHRAQARHGDLLAVVGECNAQVGAGEPFLPFREVLALLTGDVDVKLSQGVISQEGAGRLRGFLAGSVLVLFEAAPDLIGALVPGAGLVALAAKVGKAVAKQSGVESRLEGLKARESAPSPLPRPTIDRENIFEQYSRYLIRLAERHPIVVALDDLQWIDASSAELLFHLARRTEQSRILIVGTYRPVDLTAGRQAGAERHPLEHTLSELKRYRGDVTLDLDARDPAAARQFVHALVDAEPNALLSDFREALYERTAGNPLFVLELLRDLRERGYLRQDVQGGWVAGPALDWLKVPARVEGVIEGRVGRLQQHQREMLNAAGVEGEAFTAEVVARVLNLPERDTVRALSEELARQHRLVGAAGIVRLSATRISLYQFQHRLLRQYLYDRLDPAQRAYLHEDVAKALEALYEGQTDDVASQLAWHYSEAGFDRKAATYHRRVGELASSRYAHGEAIAHLTAALDLTPQKEARARYELLLAREAAYDRLGRRAEQDADLAALAGLAGALGDPRAQAEVSLRQANRLRLTGDYATALRHAQAAVASAGQAGDRLVETQGYAMVGLVLRHQGVFAEAAEWLELALEQAQGIADSGLVAQITYWMGLNQYSADQFQLAQQRVLAARDIFERGADHMGRANCSLLLGVIASRLGDTGESVRHLEEALAACRRAGWRSREAVVLGDLGSVLMEIGDYEAGALRQAEALAISREIGDQEGEAVSLDSLGLLAQLKGRHDEALALFEQALAIARRIGYRRGEGFVLTHQGYSHLERGDLAAARGALDEAVAVRYGMADRIPTVVDDLAILARVAQEEGRDSRARAYATEALERLAEHGPAGVEHPVRDYLLCYNVLRAAGDPAATALAGQALEDGYALLQKLAGNLHDASLRRRFLTVVPFNREVAAAYESRAGRT